MKNGFLTLLIMMLVLPAIMPAFSHGAIHGIHDHHAAHHWQQNANSHGHDAGKSVHHSAHFDITNYYSDFLHVDLQNPDQAVLKAPSFDNDTPQYPIIMAMDMPTIHDGLLNNQTRAPPDSVTYRFDDKSLYLSTQRLRI